MKRGFETYALCNPQGNALEFGIFEILYFLVHPVCYSVVQVFALKRVLASELLLQAGGARAARGAPRHRSSERPLSHLNQAGTPAPALTALPSLCKGTVEEKEKRAERPVRRGGGGAVGTCSG